MRRFLTFLLLIGATLSEVGADHAQSFRTANEAFLAGEFEAAYSGYQNLLEEQQISADLFYNLGNASYRLERPGEAALWYERALTLDPTHTEAAQNLRFLERSAGLLRFDSSGDGKPLDRVRRDTLVLAATVCGWLAVLGMAAAMTLRLGPGIRSSLWILSPMLLAATVLAGYGIYLKQRERSNIGDLAIVTANDSQAFTSPARGSKVISLPAGSQVQQVSDRGSWQYIEIPGNLRGWIPGDTAEPLWPYDPNLAD